ncbi:MAG: uracil-DNA glycosylase [Schleiferiaceae bacterium]|nr:uracil-DNA glycosylase [Schleiferiaceae bacterium]
MQHFLSTFPQNSWYDFYKVEQKKEYWTKLNHFLAKEYQMHACYPPKAHIFEAFNICEPQDVRCIIIGQDPYHGAGQANGLAFSVAPNQNIPPSLKNIFKEYSTDLNTEQPLNGDLSSWAHNGVFLINTALTVKEKSAGSHRNKGWEIFTENAIKYILEKSNEAGFICFGAPAYKLALSCCADFTKNDPVTLHTPHPSPLSAYRGFFGSKPFTTFNNKQAEKGRKTVTWNLPLSPQGKLF